MLGTPVVIREILNLFKLCCNTEPWFRSTLTPPGSETDAKMFRTSNISAECALRIRPKLFQRWVLDKCEAWGCHFSLFISRIITSSRNRTLGRVCSCSLVAVDLFCYFTASKFSSQWVNCTMNHRQTSEKLQTLTLYCKCNHNNSKY